MSSWRARTGSRRFLHLRNQILSVRSRRKEPFSDRRPRRHRTMSDGRAWMHTGSMVYTSNPKTLRQARGAGRLRLGPIRL